jgi:hypothetical protein
MALLLQTSDASRRGIVGDHTDGHLRICIFRIIIRTFWAIFGRDGHWRQGLALPRVSQSTVQCQVHAPQCFVSGRHLSSEPRAIVGLRFSTTSSDGKAPSSERSRENCDRRGAVSDANDQLLLKKKTERKFCSGPRLPSLNASTCAPQVFLNIVILANTSSIY